MQKKILGCALVALTFAAGCGDDKLKADTIAKAASTNTAAIVRGTGGAAQVVNQLSAVTSVVSGLNSVSSSFRSVPLANSPPCDGGFCAGSGSSTTTTTVPPPAAPPEESFNAEADRIAKYLEERIFTQENLEESDATSGTFKLGGDDICSDGTTPADPNCVSEVDKLDLRIKAVLGDPNGVDLTFLVGPNKLAPLTVIIREDSLAVQFDLAQIKATIEFLSTQQGTVVTLPRVMEGVIELKLQKNGEKDITFSSSVLAAVNVEVDGANGATQFTTAIAAPLHSLRLEGAAKKATFSLNLGRTTVAQPYKNVNASGTAGNRVTYTLSGLSYDFTAQEGQQDFTVAHVGLGDATSSYTLDGQEIYTADLNQLSGRHFDLSLQKDTDGLPIVKVTPEFDLIQKFAFGLLSADQYVAPHAASETYRVRLSGGGQPSIKPVNKNDAGFNGGLKVVTGTLELSTNRPGEAAITVPTGSCLTEKAFEDGGHPVFGHLTVTACP